MDREKYKIRENETEEEYVFRIISYHDTDRLTWPEIADIIKSQTGYVRDSSIYRKRFKAYCRQGLIQEDKEDRGYDDLIAAKIELQKERVKISDERIQTNAYIRQIAREETLKEIAVKCAKEMSSKKILDDFTPSKHIPGNKSAILELSDIHYGIIVDNYWNKYSPEIAEKKIHQLGEKTIEYCKFHGVTDLYVTNLGDAIAGRIHETIKYQSRFDVITQTIKISEIFAELLAEFAKYFKVHYYDCLDNHSRLEPNKKAALELESLARVIPWYLKERVGKIVEINDNKYGADIITFKCRGHNICGVHGDKDSPIKVVDSISMMTKENFDMVLTAHLHHFSADEKNFSLIISNPSIVATDEYAKNLRLSSHSAQNLIIVSDKEVMECLYRIVLD